MISWVRLLGVRWERTREIDQLMWRYRRDGSDAELWVCGWRRKGHETWRTSLLQGGAVLTADGETLGGSLRQLESQVLGLLNAALPIDLHAVDGRVVVHEQTNVLAISKLEEQMKAPLPQWLYAATWGAM